MSRSAPFHKMWLWWSWGWLIQGRASKSTVCLWAHNPLQQWKRLANAADAQHLKKYGQDKSFIKKTFNKRNNEDCNWPVMQEVLWEEAQRSCGCQALWVHQRKRRAVQPDWHSHTHHIHPVGWGNSAHCYKWDGSEFNNSPRILHYIWLTTHL